ncbi:hypothetical protein CCR75_000793 [Bremia lactucae]|uniref:Uncharacterized protein n=1 Tax=Bremia lactucae TaxID=4779 RepID=A0A976FJ09_BRELC|nr:hypothetical protein CCR75_007318 [Bremia lactucae]TDH72533.1 hypothetical protein CCR75_000793 [Bremia lactucae]
MVQRFPFSEELLGSLSDKVLQAWTALEANMFTRAFGSLPRQDKRKSTQKWLDDWNAKLSCQAPHNLPPLIDSNNDWKRLRNCGSGDDTILYFVYKKQVRVLTGHEYSEESGKLIRLLRQRKC